MSKKSIKRSKSYGFIGIIISCVLFIFCLYSFFQDLLGLACFIFPSSIFLLIASIMGIWDTQPRVSLDEDGIYASELGKEKILWSDIKSVQLRKIPRSGAFIVLELNDETKYPYLGYDGAGKTITNLFGLSRLTITVTGLEISPVQILNQIQQRISQDTIQIELPSN